MATPRRAATGPTATNWTTEADLRSQVERLWARGVLGRSIVRSAAMSAATSGSDPAGGNTLGLADSADNSAGSIEFPIVLKLRQPTRTVMSERFDEVRSWITELAQTPHVRIVSKQINHRVLGTNDVPAQAWIDSPDVALAFINRTGDGAALAAMAEVTMQRRPSLVAWLERRPLVALANHLLWDRLLDFIDWLEANPRPDCYLRQVDIAGLDSKFIEANRAVLAQLLDAALPTAIANVDATGVKGFEARYGFRTKPNLVRFRILDRSIQLGGLPPPSGSGESGRVADISVDADTFARLEVSVETVFIVENEVTFLAFPEVVGAMVIFGSGFGTERLAGAGWLRECQLRYWGDIDTHGFAILDELRRRFLAVESFLMDHKTLNAHIAFWDEEGTQQTRDLPRLTAEEARLYDDLRCNRLGSRLRLEQERVGFGYLGRALGS